MPGVTIAAPYGAAGSAVAPQLAQRLGFLLLDRAISVRVADELSVSPVEAETGEIKRSLADRFFGVLAPLAGGVIGYDPHGDATAPQSLADAARFRERAEQIMRDALPQGVVVLGRAGAAALRGEPDVLRVRLFGSVENRLAHAMRSPNDGADAAAVRQRMLAVDTARAHYVKRLYGLDIDAQDLYHLHLDSTALSVDGCVKIIAAAYADLIGATRGAG